MSNELVNIATRLSQRMLEIQMQLKGKEKIEGNGAMKTTSSKGDELAGEGDFYIAGYMY
jgi:hypothetical protein